MNIVDEKIEFKIFCTFLGTNYFVLDDDMIKVMFRDGSDADHLL